jgi:hypothetical protein
MSPNSKISEFGDIFGVSGFTVFPALGSIDRNVRSALEVTLRLCCIMVRKEGVSRFAVATCVRDRCSMKRSAACISAIFLSEIRAFSVKQRVQPSLLKPPAVDFQDMSWLDLRHATLHQQVPELCSSRIHYMKAESGVRLCHSRSINSAGRW